MLDLKQLDDVSVDVTAEREPSDREAGSEALDVEEMANLSLRTVETMTRDELIRVIRAARLPQMNIGRFCCLEQQDRETLLRLAFLARRCCRNRADQLKAKDVDRQRREAASQN